MNNSYRTNYISDIDNTLIGKKIKISGWVHEVRDIGHIIFLLIRDNTGIIQVTAKKGVTDDEVMKSLLLPKESVVSLTGTVVENKQAKMGIELLPTDIKNLNPITSTIPFEVTGKVPADLDVRLNFRYIDLRRAQSTSIFKIESTVLKTFRKTLEKEGFLEIRTPSIVKEATEGGTELFKLQYFESDAYLAQSPQLYKQLTVIGGFDRVFMVAPVFRAEKHNTLFHLNEITQMDVEMGFSDHNDAIKILKKSVLKIIEAVKKENTKELEILNVELAAGKIKEITYKKAIEELSKNGSKISYGDDFSKEDEINLSKIFGDLLVVKEYPTNIRAFYSMPNQKDPTLSNSFDFIYKGLELSSGAQRIHIPELLEEALVKRGNNPRAFDFYINAFRNGAPPHAGWSIGLERFVMKLTNSQNIRECVLFPRDRTRLIP
ncbi:MAG: aspartate--tRNA(Asn) ligase [Candidatus Micrarchaeia archaeon]